jgi:hypothetical protein
VKRVVTAVTCVLSLTWSAAAPQAAPPARASEAPERTITCSSYNYRYRYCRANTDNRVRLERQISFATRCRLGDTWGYDARGVWVDRGGQAEFSVGRDGGSGKTAAVVGGVAAAAIIAAAIASSKAHHEDPVESWAVGTFRGYDEREGRDVEVVVVPGGSVTGTAGDASFSGRWEKNQLQLGQYRFKVDRSGNGFKATDEQDSAHSVQFRRVGSGY